MKLRVLVDNNTIIDDYYLGEPALSFYIEDGDKKILFDTGYSDVFVLNANKMNININEINTIVLSHGHNDHTGGLVHLLNLKQNIDVYGHPNVDELKKHDNHILSSPITLDKLPSNYSVHKTKQPTKISNNITYLGEIERTIQPLRKLGDDPLFDDSAMVYENDEGIFIITACSHSGICNIVNQAKKITGKNHILGIIGGFHLLNNPEVTKEVCEYFKNENIDMLYPCHCTDLKAKIELSKVKPIQEIGVGFEINI